MNFILKKRKKTDILYKEKENFMKYTTSGFTLIELLAVVLIIAILTSIAVPQYRRSVQRAQAIEMMTNLRTLFDSAKRYRTANSEAPLKLTGLDVSFFDATTPDASSFNIGNFHYSFMNDGISACLLSNKNTFYNTYCFKMYYTYTSGSKKYKDLMVCSSMAPKYNWLCEALSTSRLDGMNVIGS